MNIQALKNRIKSLILQVNQAQQTLTRKKVEACLCGYCEQPAQHAAIQAQRDNVSALKQQGREAVFDLLVSGISHRQFMNFIKDLGNE